MVDSQSKKKILDSDSKQLRLPHKWHKLHKDMREGFTKRWTKEWIKIAILNEIWNVASSKVESSESRLASLTKSLRIQRRIMKMEELHFGSNDCAVRNRNVS